MTSSELDALKAAHSDSTQGDWEVTCDHHSGSVVSYAVWATDRYATEHSFRSADAEWIALAHNAFPRLLDLIDSQDAEIKRLRADLAEAREVAERARKKADRFERTALGRIDPKFVMDQDAELKAARATIDRVQAALDNPEPAIRKAAEQHFTDDDGNDVGVMLSGHAAIAVILGLDHVSRALKGEGEATPDLPLAEHVDERSLRERVHHDTTIRFGRSK